MTTVAPARLRQHAPGWKWRQDTAGRLERPWPADLPAHVSGLCQSGWHADCPQAPLIVAVDGCCACSCHGPAGLEDVA